LAFIQGFGIAVGLESMAGPAGGAVVYAPGWGFRLLTVLSLTAGTAFIMWLGEQITERGIGNGISLIIFAGIVTRIPSAVANSFRMVSTNELSVFFGIILVALMLAVVALIVFIERGQRRIPVQYAKRVVGRRMYGGQATHLPLKINTSGVIPPIFASSIIMFPATIASFVHIDWLKGMASALHPGAPVYIILYVGFIFFFCYFYTAVTFNPVDVAENMKKYGGYIPGIRPGKRTADYIDSVLTRITFGGAIYVAAVCILPTFLIQKFNVPFYFGGTALLIVVGVAIDTMAQIEAHMLTRHYEGFMKKGLIKTGR
jgi:preprotein translocase subunit SecY